MKRFLKSLDVVITENKATRAKVENNWNESERKYKAIVAETKNSLIYRDQPQLRHSCPPNEYQIPYSTRLPPLKPREVHSPQYVPASKFAVPMDPVKYKITSPAFNAARVMNLTKYRPKSNLNSVIDQPPPEESELPQINVESYQSKLY